MSKKSVTRSLTALIAAFSLATTGCILTYPEKTADEESGTKETVSTEASELFTKEQDGSYRFETNDIKYKNAAGYTLWTIAESISPSSEFTDMKVKVNKAQGKSSYGYGVVFNSNTGADGTTSMLCVMVRVTGEFAVGKVVNGVYTDIQYWTQNGSLKSGFGADNEIIITKNSTTQEYTVRFNDTGAAEDQFTFSDSTPPSYENGGRGFVVVLAPDENFPTNRVLVTFTPEE